MHAQRVHHTLTDATIARRACRGDNALLVLQPPHVLDDTGGFAADDEIVIGAGALRPVAGFDLQHPRIDIHVEEATVTVYLIA